MSISPLKNSIPELGINGMKGLVGANGEGVSLQAAQIVQAGASPFTVDFLALGLSEMADAAYTVVVQGAGAGVADFGSLSESGFDITGGADTDIHHVVVVGRLAGQKA